MAQRCAAANHPGFDPQEWTWQQSYIWDRKHANANEIATHEPDMDRVWEAVYLCDEDDYPGALVIWRDLVEQGSVWSMIEIGRCYEYGYGVTRDLKEAEFWYYRAFVGGSQTGMLKCAKIAAARQDYTSCEKILQGGVEQHWAPAMFWFAWYCLKRSSDVATYRAIRPLLEGAANRDHPAAKMILAKFMLQGKFGILRIPRGIKLAMQWAQRVSDERADVEASFDLGSEQARLPLESSSSGRQELSRD